MVKTYRVLKEILYALTSAQTTVVESYLNAMDDNEFKEIPVLLISDGTKKILDTYGNVFVVRRGDEYLKIYCLYPSIFRIVE